MLHRLATGFIASMLVAASSAAQAPPEILARYPNGTFLENMVERPDGTVLFTSYFARRIEAWSPGGGARNHAEVSAHPVSLTALPEGRLALIAHGASFMGGPAVMRGNAQVLILRQDGSVERTLDMPDAIFPNGAVLLAPDRLLVVDSALGRIWSVNLASGSVESWFDHPLLTPDPTLPLPGVNGIKRAGTGSVLLLSNSARRSLLSLALRADGSPEGEPVLVASMPTGIDDFAVAQDGTIVAATHAHGLALLAPGGTVPRLVAAAGVEGSTAVLLAPDGHSAYALGTGGLLEGGRGEAVLARVPLRQ